MKLMALLASAGVLLATSAFAATVLPLAGFSGIKASDGARVIIRHGAGQQVTLTEGSTEFSRLEVRDGKLDIVGCTYRCPHNYRLEVEIVTPGIAAIDAEDGASITAQGDFPAQAEFAALARDGGRVVARNISASRVNAGAEDGGMVLVRATGALNAVANDGGSIEYWGSPALNSHISDGGNVKQGN